jgi:hypothetical protein
MKQKKKREDSVKEEREENSLTHGGESFGGSRQLCSHSRNSQHFMEPEGSLPCS